MKGCCASAAQAHIVSAAPTLNVPTLFALPGEDRLVATDAALAFAKAAGAIVETRLYPHAYHELFLEPDASEIVRQLVSWLVARLPAPYT